MVDIDTSFHTFHRGYQFLSFHSSSIFAQDFPSIRCFSLLKVYWQKYYQRVIKALRFLKNVNWDSLCDLPMRTNSPEEKSSLAIIDPLSPITDAKWETGGQLNECFSVWNQIFAYFSFSRKVTKDFKIHDWVMGAEGEEYINSTIWKRSKKFERKCKKSLKFKSS